MSELISSPHIYTQRCVEQLTFFSDGGERWTRTLQIRIPPALRHTSQWWPITLGTFQRRRYPDFTVLDCNSRRLALLTRKQHGSVLAEAIFSAFDNALRAGTPRSKKLQRYLKREASDHREALISAISDRLTLMQPDDALLAQLDERIANAFDSYVASLAIPEVVFDPIIFALGVRLARENEATQYLCWVKARPGDVVNLSVTYSALDRVRDAFGADHTRTHEWHAMARRLMRLFRVFGFAAMVHRVTGGNVGANSYYFTIGPPENTGVVALLSDADGSHSDDGELDSRGKSFHIHNGDDSSGPQPAAVMRAHLLPERREHMTIAAGALLNILLVFLVASGRFINGFGAQTWILVTPTVLTGVIAQQQRHYYARATRGQRVVLWLYLMVGAVFLVAVTFSNSHIPGTEAAWGWRAKATFIAFATFSSFIAVTYTAIGPLYKTATKWLANWRAKRVHDHVWIGSAAVMRYTGVVFWYCLSTLVLALACSITVLGVGIVMWINDDFQVSSRIAKSQQAVLVSTCDGVMNPYQGSPQFLLTSPPFGSRCTSR